MVGFVFTVILGIIFVIALATAILNRDARVIASIVAFVALVIGVIVLVFSSYYQQAPGETNVVVNFDKSVAGENAKPGSAWKAPWQDLATFDIKNQQVVYSGSGANQSDNNGGTAQGPHITVQDGDGVSSDVDIAVRYSINPESVIPIYNKYLSQENFRQRLIDQDIRAVVRSTANNYSTIELLTKRREYENGILKALKARWADDGILVESIALQEITPPDNVKNAYAAAQEAQVQVTKAQAELEKQKVEAQQTVQSAQAQADANDILNAHPLNSQSLTQKYIEQLGKGTTYVVPQGSTPFIGTK